jgi:disulfide bond formation protein DsbB
MRISISDRWVFAALATLSAGSLGGALVIGEAFRVPPCYWCNFQRLLYMMLVVFGLGGVLFARLCALWAFLAGATALVGIWAAGKQSWMQYAPHEAVECGFGDPTLTERLVDWLAGLWPSMFMVTGLCKEKDWVFLGLSLANWSGVCFFTLLCASCWIMFRRWRGRP